jgi:hypothetical protein
MYARVATFESDPANVDQAIEVVRSSVESGETPEGLEGAKMLMLVNRETGKGLGVTLFESKDAMRRGDEALTRWIPAERSAVRRSSSSRFRSRRLPDDQARGPVIRDQGRKGRALYATGEPPRPGARLAVACDSQPRRGASALREWFKGVWRAVPERPPMRLRTGRVQLARGGDHLRD